MILISACLLGVACAYSGDSNQSESLLRSLDLEQLVPICPEQLGGLATPRDRARLVEGDGHDFWQENARVVTITGTDVSKQYRRGGLEAQKIARLFSCRQAILKANSPSCGCGCIFNEAVSGLISGDGTTAALLKQQGIEIFCENDYPVD